MAHSLKITESFFVCFFNPTLGMLYGCVCTVCRHVHTFTSTILVFLFQSHTDSMCSLESSITHRNVPESCAKTFNNDSVLRDFQNIYFHRLTVVYSMLCLLHGTYRA